MPTIALNMPISSAGQPNVQKKQKPKGDKKQKPKVSNGKRKYVKKKTEYWANEVGRRKKKN
jgi:hypothetical protein